MGLNVAAGLRALGHEVRLVSLVGDDDPGEWAHRALARHGIDAAWLQTRPGQCTSQTVVLVDAQGRRRIDCDLKDLQQERLPMALCQAAVRGVRAAIVGNINFARPMLQAAIEAGVPVVNTVGAGDALLAAFVAGWADGLAPRAALERAAWFAGWKVGERGGDRGLIGREALESLVQAAGAMARLPSA